MRYTSTELKVALKERFLRKCGEWRETLSCEVLKAACKDFVGCGNLDGYYKEISLSEKHVGLKRKRGDSPARGKTLCTEKIFQVAEKIGVLLGFGAGSPGDKKKKKRGKGVVEYVQDLFIPALEEDRNIWEIKYSIPATWDCPLYPIDYPEYALTPKISSKTVSCFRQKFPALCNSLGIITPVSSSVLNSSPLQHISAFHPRPANISENARGGKVRTPSPGETLKTSLDPAVLEYAYSTGTKSIEGKSPLGSVENRPPGSYNSYCGETDWLPNERNGSIALSNNGNSEYEGTYSRSCDSRKSDGEPIAKRQRVDKEGLDVEVIQDGGEEVPMDLGTPVSLAQTPKQPLQGTTRVMNTTQCSQSPPPQELSPKSTRSPNNEGKVLVAPWDKHMIVVHRIERGLPSPRIPIKTPLSYMKHRTRRLESEGKKKLQQHKKGREETPLQSQKRTVVDISSQTVSDVAQAQLATAHPLSKVREWLDSHTQNQAIRGATSEDLNPPLPQMNYSSPITMVSLASNPSLNGAEISLVHDFINDYYGLASTEWCESIIPRPHSAVESFLDRKLKCQVDESPATKLQSHFETQLKTVDIPSSPPTEFEASPQALKTGLLSPAASQGASPILLLSSSAGLSSQPPTESLEEAPAESPAVVPTIRSYAGVYVASYRDKRANEVLLMSRWEKALQVMDEGDVVRITYPGEGRLWVNGVECDIKDTAVYGQNPLVRTIMVGERGIVKEV